MSRISRALRIGRHALLVLAVLAGAWLVRSFTVSDRATFSWRTWAQDREVSRELELRLVSGHLIICNRQITRWWGDPERAREAVATLVQKDGNWMRFRWHLDPPHDASAARGGPAAWGFIWVRFLNSMRHAVHGVEMPILDDCHFIGCPIWAIVLALAFPTIAKYCNDRQRRQWLAAGLCADCGGQLNPMGTCGQCGSLLDRQECPQAFHGVDGLFRKLPANQR